MLKLYTDDSPGLKVDPVVVLVLSVGFIISVVALHSELLPFETTGSTVDMLTGFILVIAKFTKKWTS